MQATKTIEILEPHKKQYDFIKSPAKFRAFIGGLGSGKTMIGCSEVIVYAIQYPGAIIGVVAPTYRLLLDVVIATFTNLIKGKLKYEFAKGDMKIYFPNGSEVLFRSADNPEMLRGLEFAAVFGDEASLWDNLVWKILLGRIRQKGYPHRMWISSTPKGFNWIYKEFVEKKRSDYELIHCTTMENTYLTPSYIQTLKDSYDTHFAKQEIEGEFITHEGLVYLNFSRRIDVLNCSDRKYKDVMYGVDWGWKHPSVVLVIGMDADNRFYVLDEFYQSNVLIDDLVEVSKQFQQKYGEGTFYADPSQPEHIQKFNNAGLNCVDANNEILPGINNVSTALEVKSDSKPAMFIDPRCIHTLMEFEQYSYPTTKDGTSIENKPFQDKPLKIHDHAMDALRYAVNSMGMGAVKLLPTGEGVFY